MSVTPKRENHSIRAVDSVSPEGKNAAPRTVLSMNEMRMFALEVGDENGIKQPVLAFRVNGAWYHDPTGKEWLGKTLKAIAYDGWLAKTLEERLNDATVAPTAPKVDVVDIMGGSHTPGIVGSNEKIKVG